MATNARRNLLPPDLREHLQEASIGLDSYGRGPAATATPCKPGYCSLNYHAEGPSRPLLTSLSTAERLPMSNFLQTCPDLSGRLLATTLTPASLCLGCQGIRETKWTVKPSRTRPPRDSIILAARWTPSITPPAPNPSSPHTLPWMAGCRSRNILQLRAVSSNCGSPLCPLASNSGKQMRLCRKALPMPGPREPAMQHPSGLHGRTAYVVPQARHSGVARVGLKLRIFRCSRVSRPRRDGQPACACPGC